jgi:hypothetical protein
MTNVGQKTAAQTICIHLWSIELYRKSDTEKLLIFVKNEMFLVLFHKDHLTCTREDWSDIFFGSKSKLKMADKYAGCPVAQKIPSIPVTKMQP